MGCGILAFAVDTASKERKVSRFVLVHGAWPSRVKTGRCRPCCGRLPPSRSPVNREPQPRDPTISSCSRPHPTTRRRLQSGESIVEASARATDSLAGPNMVPAPDWSTISIKPEASQEVLAADARQIRAQAAQGRLYSSLRCFRDVEQCCSFLYCR